MQVHYTGTPYSVNILKATTTNTNNYPKKTLTSSTKKKNIEAEEEEPQMVLLDIKENNFSTNNPCNNNQDAETMHEKKNFLLKARLSSVDFDGDESALHPSSKRKEEFEEQIASSKMSLSGLFSASSVLPSKETSKSSAIAVKTAYVSNSTVIFWLSMWFFQNMSVTFWNKKALNTIHLPVTLTFVHMVCNTLGAYLYIYVYKGVERKSLNGSQKKMMMYFSLIFVSNIITGNWSLGLVSISLNQVMRALVPAVVIVLSMLILNKRYSTQRKVSLVPVFYGVYLTCSGEKTATFFGFVMTVVAVVFAGLKAVLSSKFLTGDLKLHPVDLILHQAPLSACWCLITMFTTGEWNTLIQNASELPSLSTWYIITGIISFMLNITSFYANKVSSAVTLSVCANVKQIMVIVISMVINHEVLTTQKAMGIALVTIGGILYAYISNRELKSH